MFKIEPSGATGCEGEIFTLSEGGITYIEIISTSSDFIPKVNGNDLYRMSVMISGSLKFIFSHCLTYLPGFYSL